MTTRKTMQDADFEALLGAVSEAGAVLRGEAAPSRIFSLEAPDVAAIRGTLQLSRARFARLMGVNARTVEGWEQGRRQPAGAARVLLLVAAKHPGVVAGVVADATLNAAPALGDPPASATIRPRRTRTHRPTAH